MHPTRCDYQVISNSKAETEPFSPHATRTTWITTTTTECQRCYLPNADHTTTHRCQVSHSHTIAILGSFTSSHTSRHRGNAPSLVFHSSLARDKLLSRSINHPIMLVKKLMLNLLKNKGSSPTLQQEKGSSFWGILEYFRMFQNLLEPSEMR